MANFKIYEFYVSMRIGSLNAYIINNRRFDNCPKHFSTSPLAPLERDTVSFGAMKKSKFEGLDLAVVEKFKAPIGKFNSNDDLQNWARELVDELNNKDFGGRHNETKIQRKTLLKEWFDYILKDNDAYNNATALVILNAITKDLLPDNDKMPPVLNKGVLADCIYEIENNVKADRKYQFDLNKMYETKLRALYLDDTQTGETETKWIVIPSKKNDPENFDANVERLKTLSHKNWCTKSFNAEPYLKRGDFHVYLENGKPKIGIRFVGDKIQEIQGEKNNGKIPLDFFDEIKNHIKQNKLKLSKDVIKEIRVSKDITFEKIKRDLKEAIEKQDAKEIFEYLGMNLEEDKDGFLTIVYYGPICDEYSWKDLGIDENWLFKKVKHIVGDADFRGSQLKTLYNLETIEGDANFLGCQVENLVCLKSIGGNANFKITKIETLGNLESIGGDAIFRDSQIKDLNNLKTIGRDADFSNSQVKDLGNLETIGRDANFSNSQVESLGKLKSIGGSAIFRNSKVKNLGKLISIGECAIFRNSQIENLNNLETIGNDADFRDSQVKDLGNLKFIGRIVFVNDPYILELLKQRKFI